MGVRGTGSFVVRSGPAMHWGVRFGTFGRPCCFARFGHHRRILARFPWWFYAYSYYPYYPYPMVWDDPATDYAAQNIFSSHYDQQLANQIDQLRDEVASLRDELRGREAPAVPVAPRGPQAQVAPAPEPRASTVLVYRDGHTREITNYAIVGQTLWVLSEQRAQKVALAELDVPATVKKNDERGVEFALPR